MIKYILSRLLYFIPISVAVLFLVFTLAYLAPGDPITILLTGMGRGGGGSTLEMRQRLVEAYGLDRSFLGQFAHYLISIVQLDFGRSILKNRPVNDMIARSLPISLQLGAGAMVVLVVCGIPLGTLAAIRKHSWIDNVIVGSSVVFRVVPQFVQAYILLMVCVLWLHITEVPFGWRGLFTPGAIMAILLLAAPSMSIVIQQTRAGVLDVLASDYVRTARGKGLRPLQIIIRHVLPNAMIPVITSLGIDMAYIITGTVFIDKIFSIPGFGQLYWKAIEQIDYPVLLATTVFASLAICLSNLFVDILYALVDPRVRYVGRVTEK